MDLKEYFENTQGFGVLSTADAEGRVDSAVYSRPHVMEDGSLAFIMADRLSHHNLTENPSAVYLFREGSEGYSGKRFYLKMVRDEKNSPLIEELRRRKTYAPEREYELKDRFLVWFEIERERPLSGD